MSANIKLLHHHFNALHSYDTIWVKPTKIPASSALVIYSQLSGICLSRFPFHPGSGCSIDLGGISRSLLVGKCVPDSLSPELSSSYSSQPPQLLGNKEASVITILKGANSFLPQVVIASTVLALIFPPSFKWFTNRYYAPALGFLMFAVGVNSSEKDFLEAFRRPMTILAGYVGQFVVKPLLGYLFGTISMTAFGLPTSLGMQSSLLALALANKFFQDPLVSIPPAISTVIMSLMGFSLVMLWARRKETAVY